MFGWFQKKHKLIDSGILQGKTDVHCHLLPGVDDGSPDVEHTMELLNFIEEVGFKSVWLTPHVMEDLDNSTEKLSARFSTFAASYQGGCQLHLSAEYMLDAGFGKLLSSDMLKLGKNHLLVETSYYSPPYDMDNMLKHIWEKGLKPLIAHPERYYYMEENDYRRLKELGYEFQLNIMSLGGYYGKRAKFVAEKLMEWGLYDFVGTDLHHLHISIDVIENMKLTHGQLLMLEQLLVNNENI